MLPRRRLSEIITYSTLNKKVCNIVVEGQSDSIIVKSFCDGEGIPVLIYPTPAIEIDCCDPKGPGGDRGRVIRISEHLAATSARRMFCIIDKDADPFVSFHFNTHCLITDLACVEVYPFDAEDFRSFVSRAFYVEFSAEALDAVLDVSQTITVVRWLKEEKLGGLSCASVDRSLRVDHGKVTIDLESWLTRSASAGGSRETWLSLASDLRDKRASVSGDRRIAINVHVFDEVFRFWLRAAKGEKLEERWLERLIRGNAHHARLAGYDFFRAVAVRCTTELAASA
jgi:hypothetical protein